MIKENLPFHSLKDMISMDTTPGELQEIMVQLHTDFSAFSVQELSEAAAISSVFVPEPATFNRAAFISLLDCEPEKADLLLQALENLGVVKKVVEENGEQRWATDALLRPALDVILDKME